MDFCHQCQRHLNGALACAGCGTPAEELRHVDPHLSAADDLVIELRRDEEMPPAAPRRARSQAAARSGTSRSEDGDGPRAGARRRGRPAGRRARRRRGRKLVIGLSALVLAAGALSLAELAMEHPGEDGAATAVQQDDTVETAQPAPDRPSGDDELPDGPSPVNEPVAATSASPDPSDDASAGTGRPSGGPSASGSPGTPSPGASAPGADGEPGVPGEPGASGGPDSPGEPGDPAPGKPAPGDPDPGNGGEPGGGQQPPSDPDPDPGPPSEPTPTPTETCDWFLWWCV
ncbi:SCO2400 family protein [Streptomyces sp. NRRL S-118]|uniref:SCO2400 family protein n=1 Tax=Streptomyces sp. NRRL S-118 TaxID=1463881 RepID=UPI0004C85DC9|nr:hypothetical protein [Streptomyces sp. NRRL S-118]